MGRIKTAFVVEVVGIDRTEGSQHRVGHDRVVRLHHHACIHKGVDADIEVFFAYFEVCHLGAELQIGEGYAPGEDTVAHDAADGVGTAQSLIDDTLHVELVEVGVEVEGALARHIELGTQTVGKGETVGDNGQIVPPACIELEVVVVFHLTHSGIVGKECVGMDAPAGILLAVAGVEGEASMKVGMKAAVGFVRGDISQRHIVVVESSNAFRQFVFLLSLLLTSCDSIHDRILCQLVTCKLAYKLTVTHNEKSRTGSEHLVRF